MAMISAPLETEIEGLKKLRPDAAVRPRFLGHEIKRVPVAIIVHPANPVHRATLGTVKEILLGKITNWSELGGADVPIRVVLVGGGG